MSADRYGVAAQAARAAVAGRSGPEVSGRCGGEIVPGGIALPYFGRSLTVTLPGLEILPDPGEMERLLLMHYLAAQGPVPSAGDWLSFHQLPAASFYERPYRRRATDRILRHFGGRPGALAAAGAAMGGLPTSWGL